jgi:hypothetical protein
VILANRRQRASVVQACLDGPARQPKLLGLLELHRTERDVLLADEEALAERALVDTFTWPPSCRSTRSSFS